MLKWAKHGHHGSVIMFFIIIFNDIYGLQTMYRALVRIRRRSAETLAPAVLLA